MYEMNVIIMTQVVAFMCCFSFNINNTKQEKYIARGLQNYDDLKWYIKIK